MRQGGVIDKRLRLISLKDASDRRAQLVCAVREGKGSVVINASDVVVEGLEISDVRVP
jgi:hypothetical protein